MSTDCDKDAAGKVPAENPIDLQLGEITENQAKAAVLKEYQAELVGFLQKARSAADDYTKKHPDLVSRWTDQHGRIKELIGEVQQIPHWSAGLADVCTLFAALTELECQLNGPAKPKQAGANEQQTAGTASVQTTEPKKCAQGLYAQRALLVTERDGMNRVCARARSELTAWEKPAQTLDKILIDNLKLIEDGRKMVVAKDPALAYDLFFKLVPMHLLIKPSEASTAKLEESFSGRDIADCVKTAQAMLMPQPTLIAPAHYLEPTIGKLVAGLSKAVEDLAGKEGKLKRIDETIARIVRQLEERKKSIDKDAREAMRTAAASAAAPKAE